MTSSPPVAQSCTAVFWGPSLRVARSVWPPGRGSRLSAGGSPRFGRDVSGNSSGSPAALPGPSEWGPHCFCRPDLTHGADSSGCASLARLQGVCCCLPPGQAALKVYLATKEGHSGLRLALQEPAAVSLVPELAPAGPPEAKWWACAGCGRGILPAAPDRRPCRAGPLLDASQAVPVDLGGHVETHAHEVILRRGRRRGHTGPVRAPDEEADRPAGSLGIGHEGMSMLATEDGGDCSAGHLLCDAEGCCARRASTPSAGSLRVPLPLRKEAHCFCRPLRAALMRAVLPSLSACLPPSPQAAPHKSHGLPLPHA